MPFVLPLAPVTNVLTLALQPVRSWRRRVVVALIGAGLCCATLPSFGQSITQRLDQAVHYAWQLEAGGE